MSEREPSDAGSGTAPRARGPEPDDGVDVTLVRWMLSLTPRERLQVLQDHVAAALKLRERLT